MQDLKDLKSRFFKNGFAAANEYRRFTVARGPVPRERFRSRGEGAPRMLSSRSLHGEGQALALR